MQNKSVKILFLTMSSFVGNYIQTSQSQVTRALELANAVYQDGNPITNMLFYNLQQGTSFYFEVHTEDAQGKQTQFITIDSSSTKGFQQAAFTKALKQYTNGIFLDFITKIEGSTKTVTVSWQAYSQDGQIIPTIAGKISKKYKNLSDTLLEFFAYKSLDNQDQIVGDADSQTVGVDTFKGKKRYYIINTNVVTFNTQSTIVVPSTDLNSNTAGRLWLAMSDLGTNQSYLIINGPESGNTNSYTYDVSNDPNMSYVQNQIASNNAAGAGVPDDGLVLSLVQVNNQVYLYAQDAFGNKVGYCLLPGLKQVPLNVAWTGAYVTGSVSANPQSQSAVLVYGSTPTLKNPTITIPPYPWQPKNL